jgi:hypothetical protein
VYSTSSSVTRSVAVDNGIINKAKAIEDRYSPTVAGASIACVTADNTIVNNWGAVFAADSGAGIACYSAVGNNRAAVVIAVDSAKRRTGIFSYYTIINRWAAAGATYYIPAGICDCKTR